MCKLTQWWWCAPAWTLAGAAAAHGIGDGRTPQESLAWGAAPWVAACLALSLLWYVRGMVRLWPRARQSRPLLLRRFACFGAGWAMLALALASPWTAPAATPSPPTWCSTRS